MLGPSASAPFWELGSVEGSEKLRPLECLVVCAHCFRNENAGKVGAGERSVGRSEYGLKMIDECRLGWQDFFVPGAWWPKATERKGDLLKA
jgi:hypothetical protein